MAVTIGAGFALHKDYVLDDRTYYETIQEMVDAPENWLPEMIYAFVKENGQMYVYNRNNEDTDLGKWRLFEAGGAKLEEELTSSANIGMISEGAKFEAGTSLEDIIRDMLVGKPLEEEDFYYGASDTRNIVSLYQFQDSTISVCTIVADNQYLIFAAKESLGEFNVQDSNGWNYNSDFDQIQITHNGALYNVLVGKNRITSPNGMEFRLSFK